MKGEGKGRRKEGTDGASNAPVVPVVPVVQEVSNLNATKNKNFHPIEVSIGRYIRKIRGIAITAQTVLPQTAKWHISEVERYEKKVAKFVPGFPNIPNGEAELTLNSAHDYAEFTKSLRELVDLSGTRATAILARALFMQLFSEFDAYTGYLLKAIYLKNDGLLKGISREIALCDLLTFESLDAVKRAMLEKEIDSFRRDSYIDQFSNLEKKFGLTLRKFKEWGEFVELSQRRNLFTHNDGLVNDQYLAVCDREGYVFAKGRPKFGDSLQADIAYFRRAVLLLSKVGLMLGYTLWGKVFSTEAEEMQVALNESLYSCLQNRRWNFVSELDDFVLSEPMRRGITDIDLRIRVINVAIGHKFSKKDGEAKKLLESLDWSATYRDFKLSIAVLEENYPEAVEIMRSIGKAGELVDQDAYHSWPLFTKFRQRPEFYETYEQIYGEPFSKQVEGEIGPAAELARSASVNPKINVAEDAATKASMEKNRKGKKKTGITIEHIPAKRSKVRAQGAAVPLAKTKTNK